MSGFNAGLMVSLEQRAAEITRLQAENASLREQVEKAREALEPFVDAFERRRDGYSKRYADRELGYANFDKMPDKWPMEKIEFSMGQFRAARRTMEDILREQAERPVLRPARALKDKEVADGQM